MKRNMPASYNGDALGGSKKSDGVDLLVKPMLESGARMFEIQKRLTKFGKARTAARAHLMFLHKNDVKLLVNGNDYQKGQRIGPNDLLTIKS